MNGRENWVGVDENYRGNGPIYKCEHWIQTSKNITVEKILS